REYGLDDKASERYLTELEILKLVQRQGDEIKLQIKWPANFRFPGPLQKKFFSSIGASLLEHLTDRTLTDKRGYASDFYYFVSPLLLVEDSYKRFVQDIYDLYLRYKHDGL